MNIYDFSVKGADGQSVSLSNFKGKALLIVNVASQCGFTPQYEGLETLYEKYKDLGFEVLGFPCNQFGGQEPGTEAEIKTFCETSFGVKFPLFAKINVNGDNAEPLFKYLTNEKPGLLGLKAIKWNFTKFLVDKNGVVVDRFAPNTNPLDIEKDIIKVLN